MIDKEQILSLTQGGLNVYNHYLGFEVNTHKNFRSPFYDDKKLRAISTMILKVHHTSFMTMENRVTLETAFGLSESFMGWIRDEIFLIFSN